MTALGIIIACLFFAAGIAGTLLPALPGAPIIWAGMLVYGLVTKFNDLSTIFFIGQALAVAIIFVIDYAAGAWGVRRYGGSRYAVIGSLAGILLGIVLMGPAGLIFGPFVGAVGGELINKKPFDQAIRSGVGTLLGLAGGMVLKVGVEICMIIWFFVAIL